MNSVLIDSAEKFGVDPTKVRQEVLAVLKKEKLAREVEVSLAFVNQKEAEGLNKKYRGIGKPTSVLSFSQQKGRVQFTPDKILRLGDIVICPPVAKKQNLDISFLVRHGLKSLLSEIPTAKNLRTGSI